MDKLFFNQILDEPYKGPQKIRSQQIATGLYLKRINLISPKRRTIPYPRLANAAELRAEAPYTR